MAVVINEFEVVIGQSESGQRVEASSQGDAGDQPSPSPQDIERMLEQKLARCERVWAH